MLIFTTRKKRFSTSRVINFKIVAEGGAYRINAMYTLGGITEKPYILGAYPTKEAAEIVLNALISAKRNGEASFVMPAEVGMVRI